MTEEIIQMSLVRQKQLKYLFKPLKGFVKFSWEGSLFIIRLK